MPFAYAISIGCSPGRIIFTENNQENDLSLINPNNHPINYTILYDTDLFKIDNSIGSLDPLSLEKIGILLIDFDSIDNSINQTISVKFNAGDQYFSIIPGIIIKAEVRKNRILKPKFDEENYLRNGIVYKIRKIADYQSIKNLSTGIKEMIFDDSKNRIGICLMLSEILIIYYIYCKFVKKNTRN